MVENKKIINAEDISKEFGLGSDIFDEAINYIEDQAHIHEEVFQSKFKQWSSIFKNIYGEDINSNLFLKHSYYASIIRMLIIIKISKIQSLEVNDAYNSFKNNDFEQLKIYELLYFYWTDLSKSLFKKIYYLLENVTFSRQDLFQGLYQQMFFTMTRHKIGEYYTSSNLVKKMLDNFYKLGDKILDPSCGSGSFLIEIVIRILKSNKPYSFKSKAFNNVYGFDINPLAILTAKVNILLLILEDFNIEEKEIPTINIYLMDSLFPEEFEDKLAIDLKKLYNSFDLVIGNPPWLTYKDLYKKSYQKKIRDLTEFLNIKPKSQYITHIELASIFFYYIPLKFLKIKGQIFFVITKSVLNGDHCYKFRSFSIFNNIEIWDFPENYFFNVNHICLKADYVGYCKDIPINSKYPISTKIFNEKLELINNVNYMSVHIEEAGAKVILPELEINMLNTLSESPYKKKFLQGATLVPRTLVFFQINETRNEHLTISSDNNILTRSKKKWYFEFQNRIIESCFRFITFLNIDLIPFHIKKFRNIFLPINPNYQFDEDYLKKYPFALKFYNEVNEFYQKNKKDTSNINTLFSNLNYWNKLTKQINNKSYIVVYNASGSNLKAAVIDNQDQNIIVASENYYYSTNSQNEAYFLATVLNSPVLSKNIKLIKSSRHIHKRPFSFPIPIYDNTNEDHRILAKKGNKYHTIVQDLVANNPKINSDKIRIFFHKKLIKIDELTTKIIYN